MESLQQRGNKSLLGNKPVAFLCSTRCDGDAVLKAYEWARQQCDLSNTIISGFHTPVEKDVYAILARRGAKLIHCLARSLPKRLSAEQQALIVEGRLLLISPNEISQLPRATKVSCATRNRYVAATADQILVGYLHPESSLKQDLDGFKYRSL